MGWMPTREGRRDFGSGVSGFFGAADTRTCFTELGINPASPPPFSYLINLTGNLKGLDIRSIEDSSFLSDYYDADVKKSQTVIRANTPFLNSAGYQVIIRYSAAARRTYGTHETVFSVRPLAIPLLGVQMIQPLGDQSPPIEIRWPDGKKETSKNYYLSI